MADFPLYLRKFIVCVHIYLNKGSKEAEIRIDKIIASIISNSY